MRRGRGRPRPGDEARARARPGGAGVGREERLARSTRGLGLLTSAAADVAIEGSFLGGVALFLFAHVLYVAAFVTDERALYAWRALPFALCAASMYAFLRPRLGALAVPVGAYVVAIAAMMWRAAARVRAGEAAGRWALFGALAFGLSDSLLALHRFHQPLPGASVAIMLTYWRRPRDRAVGGHRARTERAEPHGRGGSGGERHAGARQHQRAVEPVGLGRGVVGVDDAHVDDALAHGQALRERGHAPRPAVRRQAQGRRSHRDQEGRAQAAAAGAPGAVEADRGQERRDHERQRDQAARHALGREERQAREPKRTPASPSARTARTAVGPASRKRPLPGTRRTNRTIPATSSARPAGAT